MIKREISPWVDYSCEGNFHLEANPPNDETIGFVYLIECKGMRYIGKKMLFSHRTLPALKGQKRKRKIVKDSDWRTYTGSSKSLNAEIKKGARIERTILYWGESKSELSYVELRLQMDCDALQSDLYHNGILNVRLPRLKLKKDYHKAYEYAKSYINE